MVYHSPLGWRVIKKKKGHQLLELGITAKTTLDLVRESS